MLSLILDLVDALEAEDAVLVFDLVKVIEERLGQEAAVKLVQGILEELREKGVVRSQYARIAAVA